MPFGPWRPDAQQINANACLEAKGCRPAPTGYMPLPQLAAASDALTSSCLGSAVVYDSGGAVHTFAGDAAKLYKLAADSTWNDVSRTSGGAYSAATTARWRFGFSGGLVIAVSIGEAPQKFLLNTSTNFSALGGTPPQASYIATVRDFVVLGGLNGDLNTIHWSGLGDPEHWTTGTASCDTQTFQSGGPVRGLIGGEVGYVFQAQQITRMTFIPGSDAIFQFDTVEEGRGLMAPYSLVRVGGTAYFLASDGFYKFDLGGGGAQPLGVGKWAKWLLDDMNGGLAQNVIGAVDPVSRTILWAYPRLSASGDTLNRVLIYDWTLDEATTADVTVKSMAQLLSQGVSLDDLDTYGDIDTLAFSLDSSVWQGGAALLGLYGTDNKLSYFTGSPQAASWTTNDMRVRNRSIVKGVRPHIETSDVQASVAAREAEHETPTFGVLESCDETGNISTWASGNFARIKLQTPAGSSWSKMLGAEINVGPLGKR
jgi:hypothetical protein